MTPAHPLTVTLEAQQWNVVMTLLSASVASLINEIQQQCMAASVQVQTNGVGEEAHDA